MTKQFRPLKAPSKGITDEQLLKVRFPVMVSPKLDGLRVLHHNGGPVTSSLKPVSNNHTRKLISSPLLAGFDGEMAVGDGMDPKAFKPAISAVMNENAVMDITWWVFDICTPAIHHIPFKDRYSLLKSSVEAANLPYVKVVPHRMCINMEELLAFEAQMVMLGYEGIMLRDPNGRYKYDRSTFNEGILLKLKRGHIERGDAVVVGFIERMRNENEAYINERGLTERSVKKEGMVGRDDLGSFLVKDVDTGMEFRIGTGDGLDDNLRKQVWDNKEDYLGKTIRYEWFAYGGYNKPRFPQFIAFRPKEDMTDA